MSIHWIRNVLIDEKKTSLHILLGEKRIGDKCCIKVGRAAEKWFNPREETRDGIVGQGIELLKAQLSEQKVETIQGETFSWD